METQLWLIFSTVALAAVFLAVAVWLLFNILQEIRGAQKLGADLKEQVHANLLEVKATFLEADGSFKHLIDTLQGVGNLQQIKERVNQISASLVDEHQKITSQVVLSGRIIEQLHELISQWSEQGTDLQRAYHALANAIREEILREASQRDRLSLQLETVIQLNSVGLIGNASK